MRDALLDKKEIDVRRSMVEAVSNYPNAMQQRGIITRQQHKIHKPVQVKTKPTSSHEAEDNLDCEKVSPQT